MRTSIGISDTVPITATCPQKVPWGVTNPAIAAVKGLFSKPDNINDRSISFHENINNMNNDSVIPGMLKGITNFMNDHIIL